MPKLDFLTCSSTDYDCPPARVLYADPAWLFRDRLPGKGRGAQKKYLGMTIEQIARMPLPRLADDCWLFLWRTGQHQLDALDVMRMWGFRFTGGEVVWAKTTNDGKRVRAGMGRTVRNAHEICLIGKRGKPERLSQSERSIVFAPRLEHSAKPPQVRELIERFAEGPFVELFARGRVPPGWFGYGLEAE
jgi:N6-adenosine-specific RNA methylase IME4